MYILHIHTPKARIAIALHIIEDKTTATMRKCFIGLVETIIIHIMLLVGIGVVVPEGLVKPIQALFTLAKQEWRQQKQRLKIW